MLIADRLQLLLPWRLRQHQANEEIFRLQFSSNQHNQVIIEVNLCYMSDGDFRILEYCIRSIEEKCQKLNHGLCRQPPGLNQRYLGMYLLDPADDPRYNITIIYQGGLTVLCKGFHMIIYLLRIRITNHSSMISVQ